MRDSKVAGGSATTRAAASSIARGRPSSRAQSSLTTWMLALVRAKSGRRARARWANNVTADARPATSGIRTSSGDGRARGGTGYTCSLRRRRGMRLVTSTFNCGQAEHNWASITAASSTCSKLSTTSRSCRLSRWAATVSSTGRPPCSVTPKAWAMYAGTSSASRSDERSTKTAPSR